MLLTASEKTMWDTTTEEVSLESDDREINERYTRGEGRIVIETNREKLPGFIEAMKKPNYMDLDDKFQAQHRRAVGQILIDLDRERYKSTLRFETVLDDIKNIFDGGTYRLLPEALLAHDQNLRMSELANLFEKCGIAKAKEWIDGHRAVRRFLIDSGQQDKAESKLGQLVQYRNDAAHGGIEVDDLLGTETLLELANFVESLHDDDARRRRVHPPIPHPRAAQRIPSHPPLRLVRQREPRRDDRASTQTLGTGNACGRRGGRNRSGGGAGTRPALPLLWRPHVRHRDLRCRLPTTLPADGNEDRYLMSETATSRTRTTKGFPRWSMTRYAAARPNRCPALHSAPRPSPKRIVNATQSKLISQTSGHNSVIPQPRRLPHTHIRTIKSP
jgi:hypothetical protein